MGRMLLTSGESGRLVSRWITRELPRALLGPLARAGAAAARRRTGRYLRLIACWAGPTPGPDAAPALLAWRVAWTALATGSGVVGAHMPSRNLRVCGLPIANTVAAVPAPLNDVEM